MPANSWGPSGVVTVTFARPWQNVMTTPFLPGRLPSHSPPDPFGQPVANAVPGASRFDDGLVVLVVGVGLPAVVAVPPSPADPPPDEHPATNRAMTPTATSRARLRPGA